MTLHEVNKIMNKHKAKRVRVLGRMVNIITLKERKGRK
jgi:hypothetical protein